MPRPQQLVLLAGFLSDRHDANSLGRAPLATKPSPEMPRRSSVGLDGKHLDNPRVALKGLGEGRLLFGQTGRRQELIALALQLLARARGLERLDDLLMDTLRQRCG